tara:strand:- start:58 stop:309 length:252 start_codon:yes stop_codon:yes gene_type:complete
MSEDKEFIGGFWANEPKVDFIKCSINIKKKDFVDWLRKQDPNDEYVKIDVKVGKTGNWYAEKNNWKPKPKEEKPDINTDFSKF